MSKTLRQRISRIPTIEELSKIALFGDWSASSNGTDDYPDMSYKIVFGDSAVLSAGTTAEVWPHPSGDMGRPTTAETLSIVSSSIQDDNGGSGVDGLFIEGLDGDYNPISELVVLNGTAAVTSTNTYVHVSEMNVLNITTSGRTNVGNISVTNSSSGDRLGYIAAGDSLSKHSQFIVPAGYNGLFLGGLVSTYRSSGSGSRNSEIDLTISPQASGASQDILYQSVRVGSSSAGTDQISFPIPLVMTSKLYVAPVATAEANATIVSVKYSMLLIKDTIDIESYF